MFQDFGGWSFDRLDEMIQAEFDVQTNTRRSSISQCLAVFDGLVYATDMQPEEFSSFFERLLLTINDKDLEDISLAHPTGHMAVAIAIRKIQHKWQTTFQGSELRVTVVHAEGSPYLCIVNSQGGKRKQNTMVQIRSADGSYWLFTVFD